MSIPAGEESGLRAFTVTVGVDRSEAAFRPRWVEVAEERVDVMHVHAHWREEERVGFRVTLASGASWLLYYVPELDLWSGIADAGAVGDASSAPR